MSGFPNGFRQPAKKDRLEQLETMVSNLQMAVQVSQTVLKQLLAQFELLKNDSTNTMNLSNDLQYRTLAMLQLGAFDIDKLDVIAEELKLADYNKASDQEDKDKGFVVADLLKEDSIVILTSITDSQKDGGIFRSKFPVAQCPFEQMKKDLVGKKVGDKFEADLNGIVHHVEIIGVRELAPKVEIKEEVVAQQ